MVLAAFALAALVAFFVIYRLWLVVLHDVGPSVIATVLTIVAFVGVGMLFNMMQTGGFPTESTVTDG